LEKGKELVAKDTDEEPLFDDNKVVAELLRSAFRKLQGVGEAFDIKAHHDVYKDPTLKGLAIRIHGLAEKLKNLPVVKRVLTPKIGTVKELTCGPSLVKKCHFVGKSPQKIR
jgi:hypothetical protein